MDNDFYSLGQERILTHAIENGESYEPVEHTSSIAVAAMVGSTDPNTGCSLIASIAAKLHYPPALEPFVVIAYDQ